VVVFVFVVAVKKAHGFEDVVNVVIETVFVVFIATEKRMTFPSKIRWRTLCPLQALLSNKR